MRKVLSPVRAPDAKHAMLQLWEMLHWGARLLVTPNDYRTFRLYRRGVGTTEALRFLSGPRSNYFLAQLNPEPRILQNKLEYEDHFSGAGLPVPRTLAVIGESTQLGDRAALEGGEEVSRFIREFVSGGQQLAIKPIDAQQGKGVLVIVALEGQEVLLSNSTRKRLTQLTDDLVESGSTWLVQRRIRQHAFMDALNASSLNTLRLVTFRHVNDSVGIDYTLLRIGRREAQIDGYSAGGLAVRIDPKTGLFAGYASRKAKYSLDIYTFHPDSNLSFSGLAMPFWEKTVELAQEFAVHAGANRFIGWDIAITPDGPLFVEGNHDWDVGFAQLDSSGMLTDEFVELMRVETGVQFDVTSLPPFKPIQAAHGLIQSR